MGICLLLNTESVLKIVLVIPIFHKYCATPKNIISNTNKENMQGVDDIINFGMKIDDSANVIHIIVEQRYITGLAQITGNSLAFSENFFNKICPTAKRYII